MKFILIFIFNIITINILLSIETINSGDYFGPEVYQDNAHSWGLENHAHLIINGGSFLGGTVSGTNAHSYGILNTGNLNVSSGLFQGGGASGLNPHSYGLFNNFGNVNISSGSFRGGSGRGSYGFFNNFGTADVSGGEFEAFGGEIRYGLYNNGGNLTISGGSIYRLANNNSGSVAIRGGNINEIVENNGKIHIYATNISLAGGLYFGPDGKSIYGSGTISGTWMDSGNQWSINLVPYTYENSDSKILAGENPYITPESNWEFEIVDNSVKLTKLTNASGHIEIPNTINDIPVKKIGSNIFAENSAYVTSIHVPPNVEIIEDFAFYNCTSLTQINFSEGLVKIGHQAFAYCLNLTSVTLPESLEKLDFAFINCPNIVYVYFGRNLSEILINDSWHFFPHSQNLTSININPANQFYEILDGVLFTKNLKTLLCWPLGKSTSYVIPDGVEVVGGSAFRESHKLESIVFADTVHTVEICAFTDCINLKNILFNDGLKSIKHIAFLNTGVAEVELPKALEVFSNSAFARCSGLARFTIANDSVFFRTLDGVLYNRDLSALIVVPGGKLGEFRVPDSVTAIESNAFYMSSLSKVVVTNNVSEVPNHCFYGASNLRNVYLSNKIANIKSHAFSYTSSLEGVYFYGPPPTFESYAFLHSAPQIFYLQNRIGWTNTFAGRPTQVFSDSVSPSILLQGENPMFVYKGTPFIDPGATVTDNADDSWTISGNGSVDSSAIGNFTLNYVATDLSGNMAQSVERIVVVILDPDGDEDGDGLKNSVETDTGVFVSGTDTGTNPLLADTNGDGFKDGRALGAGLNPLTDYSAAIALVKQLSAEEPGCFDLYTSDAMMDMNIGELVIRKTGSMAEVDLQFQTTPDLAKQPFADFGEPYRFELPMPGNKGFLRVRASGAP